MNRIEIEVDGKVVKALRDTVVPAAGDVISLHNSMLVVIKRRHWVIDTPPQWQKGTQVCA